MKILKKISFLFALICFSFISIYLIDRIGMPLIEGKYKSLITIPDITGLKLEDAIKKLENINLNYQIADSLYDANVDSGSVIYFHPNSGGLVKNNRVIKLVVSLGIEYTKVPNLVGVSPSVANYRLQELGLRLGTKKERITSRHTPGTIISFFPPLDSLVTKGTFVDVVIAQRSMVGMTFVPNLLTLNIEKAESLLKRYSLLLRQTTKKREKSLVPGTVMEQSIIPLSKVDKGTLIDLVVSE